MNDSSLSQTNVSRSLNRSNSRSIALRQNSSGAELPVTTKTLVVLGRSTRMLSIARGMSAMTATVVRLTLALASLMKRASPAAWMIGVVGNSRSPYFSTNAAAVPPIDTTRSNRPTAVVVAWT